MEQALRKTISPQSDNLEYIAAHMESNGDDLLKSSQSLSIQLQRTLDIELILSIFCQEAAKIAPCESVAYRNDQQQLFIYHGEKHQHLCQYSLELENQLLGHIECSASHPFSERDLMRLEHLLALLVFPLRNGLLYCKAIQSAQTDPLTQLANRSAFTSAVETEISRAHRHNFGLCMLVVDIDHFKKINDTYGHLAGDQVLKHVASSLQNAVRKEDLVCRYGGEEFVVLLSATDLPNARLTAERIRIMLASQTVNALEQNISVTASIGVSQWQDSESVNTLFHRADQALYQAKDQGRNQVKVA